MSSLAPVTAAPSSCPVSNSELDLARRNGRRDDTRCVHPLHFLEGNPTRSDQEFTDGSDSENRESESFIQSGAARSPVRVNISTDHA